MAERSPADIARETLKLIAARRLQPTPEVYQAIYEEVAGLVPQVAFPKAPLRRIASVLPTQTPTQQRITRSFAQAVEQEDWTALQSAIADFAKLDIGAHGSAAGAAIENPCVVVETVPSRLASQLARSIESTISALGEDDERMRDIASQLVNFLRHDAPPLAALEPMLGNYSYRLSFTAEDHAQRRLSIHASLRMVGEHIASIASNDAFLQRQAQALAGAMEKPWTLQQLDVIQTHLKNLLFRHLEIDSSRNEAHQQLKRLLAEHTEQMTGLGKLSESHASALHECATQIQQTQDLGELAQLLKSVVQSGNALVTENRIVHASLEDLRDQTQAQERTIEHLSSTLAQVEDSTRHDPETGTLNALGMQEAMLSEAARNQRLAQPTSLASLQIDPLSELPAPEALQAQSAALVHLARLVRSTLRPQDALGRMQPQQFAILFPGTEPTQTAQALARLQTALRQRPLLWHEQRIALSFSAGVTAIRARDTPAESLARASYACEQAQHMGMARVMLA